MKNQNKSKAGKIIQKDKELFFTTTRVNYDFVPSHGEAEFVYDIDGKKFIDFSSFISVYNLGINSNNHVREGIKKQVEVMMHSAFTDYYSALPIEFAEELIKFMPVGFGRMFLSNSGTEANEAAIKISKILTKRQYILAFYNGFHGRTMGSLGLTASKTIHKEHFGPFPNVIHTPFAYCYRCPFNLEYPGCGLACIDHIKKYPLSKELPKNELAAIFFEPIQGEGGYIVPPKDYFKELEKIAHDAGALMIADEVQAGFMRTGKFLSLDNFGITADIYTMAKAIGGGLPLGVTIAKKSLGDIPTGSHASTFGGNLLSVRAGLESLKYLHEHHSKISYQIKNKSRHIMKRLNYMKERYEIVGDVRGLGLMIGVELVESKKTKEPAKTKRDMIIKDAFLNGLIMLPAGESSFRIIPPFDISENSIDKGLDIIELLIAKYSNKS